MLAGPGCLPFAYAHCCPASDGSDSDDFVCAIVNAAVHIGRL